MAGDEEVEAVALWLAGEDGDLDDFPTNAGQVRDYQMDRARNIVAVVDRVRSRPAGGTEGEDHEASARDRRWVKARLISAGFQPDEVERMAAAYLSRVSPSPAGGTEPDTAKLRAKLDEMALVDDTCDPHDAGYMEAVVEMREFLAGFSVDTGNPEERHTLATCERNLKAMPNYSQFHGIPAVFVCECGRRFEYIDDEAEGAEWRLVEADISVEREQQIADGLPRDDEDETLGTNSGRS